MLKRGNLLFLIIPTHADAGILALRPFSAVISPTHPPLVPLRLRIPPAVLLPVTVTGQASVSF